MHYVFRHSTNRKDGRIPEGMPPGEHDPLSVQFLSFLCNFRQKSCQIRGFCPILKVGAPSLRQGYPGSATVNEIKLAAQNRFHCTYVHYTKHGSRARRRARGSFQDVQIALNEQLTEGLTQHDREAALSHSVLSQQAFF